MPIRVVMLGDIVGHAGVRAVVELLPAIRRFWEPHAVIVNAENAANGSGLIPSQYQQLCKAGVDAITLGDHAFRKQQIFATLASQPNICRPANLSHHAAGRTHVHLPLAGHPGGLFVVTVLGQLFINNVRPADPFTTVDALLDRLPSPRPIVIVEVHAEATSEKVAMGWYLNGRVGLVAGTHTHVPTADARILTPAHPGIMAPDQSDLADPGASDRRTAYISDLGMCGSRDSVLGRRVDRVLKFMTTAMPAPFDPAEDNPAVNGVVVTFDEATGGATGIERLEMTPDAEASVPGDQ